MAVTPVGNPYVESSDLVANYPGASEALAERIDIVGVNPFADSAARATAIPSPVEGQMASLNDDDQVYRYSGSAWVAVGLQPGLNPVAPTSIANTSGSATLTGFTTDFTSVNNVSLNGVFTSSFDTYIINFRVNDYTTSQQLSLRYRVAGTDNSASAYKNKGGGNGASTVNVNQDNVTSGQFTNNDGPGFYQLAINSPSLAIATRSVITGMNDNDARSILMAQLHNVASAFDGITFIASTGTMTGTIAVYGYRK